MLKDLLPPNMIMQGTGTFASVFKATHKDVRTSVSEYAVMQNDDCVHFTR